MARTDQRVGKILGRIALPHYPFNENSDYAILSSQKVNAIKVLLDEFGFDTIIDKKYGVIVSNSKEKDIEDKLKDTSLIVISHIDNIKKFNKVIFIDKKNQNILII